MKLTGWITGAVMAFCVSFAFLFVFAQIAKPMIRQEINTIKEQEAEAKKKIAAEKNKNVLINRLAVRNKDLEHKVSVLELQQSINEDKVVPCSLNLDDLEMQSKSLKESIQQLRLQRMEELRQELERLDKLKFAWN